jgi:hypothetical protein
MKEKLKAVVIVSLLIFLNGCGGAQIRGDFSNGTWFYEGPIKRLETPLKLSLSKFTLGGQITDPHLVGEAKTGALNSRSDVISNIPVQDIFYNSFNDAFKKMGFIVTDDKNSADLIVSGEIQQFWTREFATGWAPEYAKASIRYDIVFKNPAGKVFWAKSIDTEGKSDSLGALLDATGSLLPTLKKTLLQSIDQVINDAEFQADLNKLAENRNQVK